MSQTSIGLYDGDGNVIIEYNEFDAKDIRYLHVATGSGSTGKWSIQSNTCTPGKYMQTKIIIIIKLLMYFYFVVP